MNLLTTIMALRNAETAFLKAHPTATGIMKRVFLEVALADEGGAMPREIERALGISYSSARRILEHLGPGGSYRKKGLGLVRRQHPRLYSSEWVLTDKGRRLLADMVSDF